MEEFFYNHSILAGIALGGLLSAAVGYKLYRRWVGGRACHSLAVLSGKTAIITGANTGIGLETAVDLSRRGARVILACRSVERGEKAAAEVRRRSGNRDAIFARLDLASLESVHTFARDVLEKEAHIDILVNNAGVSRPHYHKTEDGFESHMGVNHLGHFLLTNLLLPSLISSPQHARVVNVGSSLYKRSSGFDFATMKSSVEPKGYSGSRAYSQSKLANILFTRALSRRLKGSNVCTYVLHPGVIFTSELGREHYKELSLVKKILFRLVGYLFLKTPQQGAQTTVYCAVAEELEGVSGRYYGNCQEEKLVTAVAMDDDVAEELWTVSEKMVGLQK